MPPKRWWNTFSEKDAPAEMKKWQNRGTKIENHVTRVSYETIKFIPYISMNVLCKEDRAFEGIGAVADGRSRQI